MESVRNNIHTWPCLTCGTLLEQLDDVGGAMAPIECGTCRWSSGRRATIATRVCLKCHAPMSPDAVVGIELFCTECHDTIFGGRA